ncbi:MAG: universal stress protein [Desulfobacterium sp.]|jgi:nucleotide-binding universal stress UspA family protein|nr:universal stress protein [Desulfobacterium sp.]
METTFFHVFRNTPLGREIFMQSLYFCKHTRASIKIYIPEFTKFLMYFDNDVVQVDLDESYLTQPTTARSHAIALAVEAGVEPFFIPPMNFTALTLPDVSVDFDFMCCPRSISDFSSKISLGHIGPRVRRIVNAARFPVLIPSSQFKEWKSIMVFFGGSANAVNALNLGLYLSRITELPLDLFTQAGELSQAHFVEILKEHYIDEEVEASVRKWHFFQEGKFEHNLFDVPHNALAVLGAYGHGLVKEMLFGSTMEMVQSTLPNPLLIAGPNYLAGSR